MIAAFQPPAIRELLVTEMIEQSLTRRVSRKSMSARLDALRAQGFEEAPSDTVQGIVDVAFPIFDGMHPGAIASLNMPYLTQRDAHMTRSQARRLLSHTARSISKELGAVN